MPVNSVACLAAWKALITSDQTLTEWKAWSGRLGGAGGGVVSRAAAATHAWTEPPSRQSTRAMRFACATSSFHADFAWSFNFALRRLKHVSRSHTEWGDTGKEGGGGGLKKSSSNSKSQRGHRNNNRSQSGSHGDKCGRVQWGWESYEREGERERAGEEQGGGFVGVKVRVVGLVGGFG